MSRLDDALARLATALDRLDACAGEKQSREVELAELDDVKTERERLLARVATLEEEARNLASLTAEVDDRLDGAIAEIREVLARN
jgi:uncharacterized protein DUF4164